MQPLQVSPQGAVALIPFRSKLVFPLSQRFLHLDFVIWHLSFDISHWSFVIWILNFDTLPSASNLRPSTLFPLSDCSTAALNNVRSRKPGQHPVKCWDCSRPSLNSLRPITGEADFDLGKHYPLNVERMRTALVPPNPKELDIAIVTSFSLDLLGT